MTKTMTPAQFAQGFVERLFAGRKGHGGADVSYLQVDRLKLASIIAVAYEEGIKAAGGHPPLPLHVARFDNGNGDHVAVLVHAEEFHAEALAREAIEADNFASALRCQELASITVHKPALENDHGAVLIVEPFDHEEPGSIDGLL